MAPQKRFNDPRLAVELAGMSLSNPVLLASGVLGITASLLQRVADFGAGGVVMKTISKNTRDGYDNPVIVESPAGVINAIGIPNPGYMETMEEVKQLKDLGVPLICSIMGDSAENYAFIYPPEDYAAVCNELSLILLPEYSIRQVMACILYLLRVEEGVINGREGPAGPAYVARV